MKDVPAGASVFGSPGRIIKGYDRKALDAAGKSDNASPAAGVDAVIPAA